MTSHHCLMSFLGQTSRDCNACQQTDIYKGATIRYPGGGARKNFEINKFLLKNGEINKFLHNSGEKNIGTQAPCISSVTQNVGRNIFASL